MLWELGRRLSGDGGRKQDGGERARVGGRVGEGEGEGLGAGRGWDRRSLRGGKRLPGLVHSIGRQYY